MRGKSLPCPRHDLHQQGGAGDEGPDGAVSRWSGRVSESGYFPRFLRLFVAGGRGTDRVAGGLFDFRCGRSTGLDQAGDGDGGGQPEAGPGPRDPERHIPVQERAAGLAGLGALQSELLRRGIGTGLPPLRRVAGPEWRGGFRRPVDAVGAAPPGAPGYPGEVPGTLPVPDGGRVPGYQRSAVPAGQAADGGGRKHLRGRGPGPVHLLVAQRGHTQHPELPERLPCREDHFVEPELPLHQQHPGGSAGVDLGQRDAVGERPLHGQPRRGSGAGPRGLRRGRGSRLRHRRNKPAGAPREDKARRLRRDVPGERPVPGLGGGLHGPGCAVPLWWGESDFTSAAR